MSPALRPWALVAAALGSAAAIMGLFWLVTARVGGATSSAGAAMLEAGFTVALAAVLAGVAGVGMRMTGRPRSPGVPASRGTALGALLGLACLLVATLYAQLAGDLHPAVGGTISGSLALGAIAITALASAEELFFRGWLQSGLARDWNEWAAVAVSALAFALLHLMGGARAPLSLVNLFLAGLLFGMLRARTGGLAAPVAAHSVYNLTEQLGLGLDPNPGTGSFGALWNLDLTGAPIWGGSTEGLNASVGLSLALLAAVLPLLAGMVPPWRRATRA
jgi:hypothetical protein